MRGAKDPRQGNGELGPEAGGDQESREGAQTCKEGSKRPRYYTLSNSPPLEAT